MQSDWLAAGQLKLAKNFDVTARALFQSDLTLTKAETRLGWRTERLSLASTYSRIIPDITENRPDQTTQMTLDASYTMVRNWAAELDWRYYFESGTDSHSGVGLAYLNECVSVDLSL